MKIIINETEFDNIEWSGNNLKLITDMSLSEIEDAFSPGEEDITFSIYEGDVEIARYYNKGISAIAVTGGNPRTVVVEFNLTQLDENAEDRIQTSLDDSDGAIEELAAMVAELYDLDIETALNNMNETINTLNAWCYRVEQLEEINQTLKQADQFEGILGRLDGVEHTLDEMREAASASVIPEPEVTIEETTEEPTEEELTQEEETTEETIIEE